VNEGGFESPSVLCVSSSLDHRSVWFLIRLQNVERQTMRFGREIWLQRVCDQLARQVRRLLDPH